ncbi:MAG: hypothetical protein U0165_07930 [Polyangiaceae bacterium]
MTNLDVVVRAPRAVGYLAGALISSAALLVASSADARPGTHAPAISTWDTRASTVVPGFTIGMLSGGHLDFFSYNANFSSTSGNLSSQFGLHYVNYKESEERSSAHGVSGGAVALYSRPLGERFDNGVPKLALATYFGGVPVAVISGEYNYLSVPIVIGLGLPISPSRWVTVTPWLEVAPSFNLDTVIHPYSFSLTGSTSTVDPVTGKVNLSQSDVEKIVKEAVTIDTSFAVGARFGLSFTAHINDTADLNLNAMASTLGSAFKGTFVAYGGANVTIRWDDIVPAVLPAETRVQKESCEVIENRFKQCPTAKRIIDDFKKKEDEVKSRDEEIKKRDEAIKKKDDELKKRDEEIKRLSTQLANQPATPSTTPLCRRRLHLLRDRAARVELDRPERLTLRAWVVRCRPR